MNLPNILTVGRMVLVMIFVVLAANAGKVFFPDGSMPDRVLAIRMTAYVLAILAGVTDLLDGYLYVTGRIKDLIIIRGRNIWPQDIEYIAEQEPEIHSGDAIAFVTAQEKIILQIQCRISDEERRGQLIHALAARIQSEFGVTAAIDLLPPHSIPRTSSGKPARAEAKKRYQKAYAASLHVQESLA